MHDFEHIHKKRKSDNRYIIGLIFIVVGAILLGRNFHFLPYWVSNIFISWQMLLIAIGLVSIFVKKNLTSGLILISVGGIFMLNKFMFFSPFEWQMIWPAAFVFVGILLISNVIGSRRKPNKQKKKWSFELEDLEEDDDFINSFDEENSGKKQ